MRSENATRVRATADASTAPAVRWGIVNGAQGGMLKVRIQPEDVQTDWLPIMSAAVGGGWGLIHMPPNGTPVLLVPDTHDNQSYVVAGSTWSAQNQAPGAAQGEVWLVHSSGSQIQMTNDGHIMIKDHAGSTMTFTNDGKVNVVDGSGCSLTFQNNGTAEINGTLLVTGDIIDINGGHGSLNALRNAYDAHTHGNVTSGGANTSTTDITV